MPRHLSLELYSPVFAPRMLRRGVALESTVAITDIGWIGGGYDLHLVAGEVSAPLNQKLYFRRKIGAADQTTHFADLRESPPDVLRKPPDVQVQFQAEFKGSVDLISDNIFKGHGVTFDTTLGVIVVDPAPLPEPRLFNFLVRAMVRDTTDNSKRDIRIRVHVHERIRKIWLTPKKLVVHRGTENQQFTVLAEFDDETYGDITGRRDLVFTSGNPALATVDAATGIVRHVADGPPASVVTVALGQAPADPDLSDSGIVLTRPSLATERRIVRVGGLVPLDFHRQTNILFLPDGFTSGEQHKFADIVEHIVKWLQVDPITYPYSLLNQSINYWRLADEDFLVSEEENVSLFTEGRIVPRAVLQTEINPLPEPPGSAATWTLPQLIFKVGLPVPADGVHIPPGALAVLENRALLTPQLAAQLAAQLAPALAAKLKDWHKLYDGVLEQNDPHVSVDLFSRWLPLHSRKLFNERCTALGFRIGEHPRVDVGASSNRYLILDDRRVGETEFLAMIRNLRTGEGPGIDVVGPTWVDRDGASKGLVCVICRGGQNAGARAPIGFATTLGESIETPVEASAFRGWDLVKMELAPVSPFRLDIPGLMSFPERVHPSVSVTVAHECGHAFGLGDEYGGGFAHPSHRDDEIKLNGNLQPSSDLPTPIDPARIKWNWPRLTAGARLVDKPTPVGTDGEFDIDVQMPGQAPQFALGETVMLRKKDFIVTPPSSGLSGLCEVTQTGVPGRVRIKPESGTISPDDFQISSVGEPKWKTAALVRPVMDAATPPSVLTLIAPSVLARITGATPLNRMPPALCVKAADPGSVMVPTGLPPNTNLNVVGLYDGGHIYDCGVFHPAGLCLMRRQSSDQARSARFCHVCQYLIIDRVDPTKHGILDSRYPSP